ncbi:ParB family chromosome partitioning protein [Litorivivens lipolytica]|uniref:Probable chromosome-partitioning protein ParB n=1 Tax=Litorivivens lipolytica TaxID=1524264 RepID=A0A7W4W722_9GAMM|nr:ParB/RepB/Spo0J family partition protein [Litorivivens lipolytica]MBB3048686.1 ParB family chromosome partitioning protein [Litorivivens lipolytica]
MAKKRGLGRGLDALLGSQAAATTPPETVPLQGAGDTQPGQTKPGKPADGELRDLPVDLIQRGKYQPRRDMQPEALEELAESIKSQGVMQPIVVRPISDKRFEIIAGERRWRATQLAGLDTIPALIREVPDEAAVAMALIENIQREDLNPMEEALALQRLQREFELTHAQVAEAVGKSRTTITNLLRLTNLRDEVQRMLEHGDLEMGHARALLALPSDMQASAASQIVGRGLSVRQTEALVRRLGEEQKNPAQTAPKKLDPDIKKLQDDLSEQLGSPVQVQHSAKGAGKLVIKYANLDQLDGIISKINS